MAGSSAETPSPGIGNLLFTKRFLVPNHQRDYSWTDDHVKDLIDDIRTAIENNDDKYFIGLMVFMEASTGELIVLDGQQRLATTVIIFSAIRNWLNQYSEHKEDAQSIQMQFIGRSELGERQLKPRMNMNSANDKCFSDYIIHSIAITEVVSALSVMKRQDRNRKILEAARYTNDRIQDIAKSYPSYDSAAKHFIDLIKYMRDKVSVVTLNVSTEGTAYTIFESLNDRGLELSPLDLVKNRLFSMADDGSATQLRDMESRWTQMMSTLSNVKRDAYLKSFWISRYGRIRTPQLFDAFKESCTNSVEAVDLSMDLLAGSEHYAALSNANDVVWSKCSNNTRASVDSIRLLGGEQTHPLLLAGIRCLSQHELERVVWLVEVFIVRYIVIVGGNTGRFETTCARVAKLINDRMITTAAGTFDEMRDVYPSDLEFKNSFIYKQERNNQKCQYILRFLQDEEDRIRLGKTAQERDLSAELTLEHVFPQNASTEWKAETDSDARLIEESYAYRLGNMCLLSDLNRSLGRKGFEVKKPILERSTLTMTSEIAQNETWGVKSIEHRQHHMAKRATFIWRFQ